MACLQSQISQTPSCGVRRQQLVAGRLAVSKPIVSIQKQCLRHGFTQPAMGAQGISQVSAGRDASVARATYHGSVMAQTGTKYAVVVAKFNSLVTKGLLEGALEVFESHGVPKEHVDVAWVPGAFELPVVAKSMAKSGAYAGVVCIGAVIRGATAHYDAVVGAATSGVLGASTDTGVPVVFGVLTTDNLEQALDRTGGKVGNKGGEAALTAIEMASLLSKLKAEGKAAW